MRRSLEIILVWLIVGFHWVFAYSGPPTSTEARPENGIYDPANLIPEAGKTAILREAGLIRESSGLDMLVVVVEQLNGWEPQALADDLANRWGYLGGRALVLWVPSKGPENPWISISGMVKSQISAERMSTIVERAKKRGRTNPNLEESVRRTVVSLGEDLRFIAGSSLRKADPTPKTPKIRATDVLLIFLRDYKKIALGVVLGVGALILLIHFTRKLLRHMRMVLIPRRFPDVSWKRRFGAPNGAIVYTSTPKKRHHTHGTN